MFTNDLVASINAQLNNHVVKTPCVFSPYLSDLTEANVYLKLESLQRTGSFKERGVLSFLLRRPQAIDHVVTASAGNHAQALALHAKTFGLKATIFMPEGTSNTKIARTEGYGAEVKVVGQNYDEAYAQAFEFAQRFQAQYVPAYDHEDIILGQATVGLEILLQVENPQVIFVPVGGGGLIAGISQFVANINKESALKIVGVQARDFLSMANALAKGQGSLGSKKTIAEGIAIKKAGNLPVEICQRTRPEFCSVEDTEIEDAIMILLERQRVLAEGAGAAPVAALLKKSYRHSFLGQNVVLVISGGNIDISLLNRLSSQALVKSSRLCRMSLVIKDTPGSLSKLLQTVTRACGNIVDINHERMFSDIRWNEVLVDLIVETKGEEHKKKMLLNLAQEGYTVQVNEVDLK